MNATGLVRGHHAATLLRLLLDFGFGVNVRVIPGYAVRPDHPCEAVYHVDNGLDNG